MHGNWVSKEVDAGVFQDRLRHEIERQYPGHLPRWQSGDIEYRMPGGESRRDLIRRGHEVFRAIRESGHREVCIIAHGGSSAKAIKNAVRVAGEFSENRLNERIMEDVEVVGELREAQRSVPFWNRVKGRAPSNEPGTPPGADKSGSGE